MGFIDSGPNISLAGGAQVEPGIVRITKPSDLGDGIVGPIAMLPSGILVVTNVEQLYTHWGKMWGVVADALNIAGTTETAALLFSNPNGSGKILKIKRLLYSGLGGTNLSTFRIYKDPTVTANGTTLAPIGNRDTNQATLSSSVFTLPTVSTFGTKRIDAFRTQGAALGERDFEFGLWVEPNHTLLITATISVGSNPVTIICDFAEE